jgi:dUTP pyrophosphatase
MIVKIKKLHPNATIPKQATELAGGWDVTVTEIQTFEGDDDIVICKLGFALQLPKGYKLTLVPRSSITNTKWFIQNSPGLGDGDFLQEYQLRFRALPIEYGYDFPYIKYPEFPYKVGDRVGQVYLEEVIPIEFEEVEEFDITNDRGGYGSTGLKSI